ncbi:uncharacterized protein LOC144152068 [Haemaphysalis longicornis]
METAEVVALCMQTSGVTEEPHRISLKISCLFIEPRIVEGQCMLMRTRAVREVQTPCCGSYPLRQWICLGVLLAGRLLGASGQYSSVSGGHQQHYGAQLQTAPASAGFASPYSAAAGGAVAREQPFSLEPAIFGHTQPQRFLSSTVPGPFSATSVLGGPVGYGAATGGYGAPAVGYAAAAGAHSAPSGAYGATPGTFAVPVGGFGAAAGGYSAAGGGYGSPAAFSPAAFSPTSGASVLVSPVLHPSGVAGLMAPETPTFGRGPSGPQYGGGQAGRFPGYPLQGGGGAAASLPARTQPHTAHLAAATLYREPKVLPSLSSSLQQLRAAEALSIVQQAAAAPGTSYAALLGPGGGTAHSYGPSSAVAPRSRSYGHGTRHHFQ